MQGIKKKTKPKIKEDCKYIDNENCRILKDTYCRYEARCAFYKTYAEKNEEKDND